MKNYHFRYILLSDLICTLVILVMWFTISIVIGNITGNEAIITKIGIIAFIALCACSFLFIVIAIYTQLKVIVPTSRMLKSANLTPIDKMPKNESELNALVSELQYRLRDTDKQKTEISTILNHLNDGVISFDMDGTVNYINPAAKYLLELRDTDDTFTKIFSKFGGSEKDNYNLEKIIYLDNLASSDNTITNNVGTMTVLFVPFKDEINRPTGLMTIIHDITNSVKNDEMRKRFVADVSHELKTPLTSIKGFSETLLDGVQDVETVNHFIKVIYENAERMEKLVQDLLTLSKYDRKTEIKISTFDLGKLTKSCVEKFEIEVQRKGQKLNSYVTSNIPDITGDYDGLERVIINIISNSVKYTPEGGSIDVYVGSFRNIAYIKIKDTGIGISRKDLDRVFDRFYRVDKARSREMGGTGLGLSIAKQIVEQNGGNIEIKSETGKGTEVIIQVPIKNDKE